LVVLARASLNHQWRYPDPPTEPAAGRAVSASGGSWIKDGRRTQVTQELTRTVVELYVHQGRSTRAVAGELNLAKSTVLRILKSEGVERKPKGRHY